MRWRFVSTAECNCEAGDWIIRSDCAAATRMGWKGKSSRQEESARAEITVQKIDFRLIQGGSSGAIVVVVSRQESGWDEHEGRVREISIVCMQCGRCIWII